MVSRKFTATTKVTIPAKFGRVCKDIKLNIRNANRNNWKVL